MDPGAPGSDRPGAGAAGPIELAAETLAQLFAEARTFSHFVPRPIPLDLLKRMYELAEWGPTSANSLPARFVFVVSSAAKERLRPVLSSGNVAKTMAAPATVIVAYDSRFYESLALTNPRSAAR